MYQNSGNILMISDEEHDLNLFRNRFVSYYNIFTAETARRGHQIMEDYDIHVVLIKQKMSEMTGLQFSESIAHSYPNVIKIILADTEDTESLDLAVKKSLIYRYVHAPYANTDLKMVLDGALKLSEAEYKNRQLSGELEQYKNDRENILKLFKRYVPAEVVSQALNTQEDQLISPGESRVVSVLFADIRGFTKFASHLRPSQVVDFLNYYWQEISECVKQNKGSVNKYMGDGLLAVFGAPVSHIDNHKNAVSAALDMIDRLTEINEKYAALLGTEIKIGIGINSGEVVVGNIGTDSYMEYTVIGNTVNIASRMESISKKKPNSIIISEDTERLIKNDFETSAVQLASIKGRDEKISYYEVKGKKSENIYNIRPSRENL
jgi:class 3 adenylate cyclase